MRFAFLVAVCVLFASLVSPTFATIVYGTAGSNYSQNFDTLANTGTPSWTNDSTVVGWNLFRRTSSSDTTPVASTAYSTGTGSSNTGNFYSFGAASSTERALGGVGSSSATNFGSAPSGTVAGWIAANITNTTGGTLSSFTLTFNGEQWRDGGSNGPSFPPVAQTMVFEYGFGSTFAGVTTWTAPGGNFDWTSPVFVNTSTGAAVDGNVAGLVSGRGGTVSGLSWPDSTTLWLRWIERNDTGNDHGLAIDNLSFSAVAVAVPEPVGVLFGTLICGVVGIVAAGRRLLT